MSFFRPDEGEGTRRVEDLAAAEYLRKPLHDEYIVRFYKAAIEHKRVKYLPRPKRNPMIAHKHGYPIRALDSWHAANKLHNEYLRATEERRRQGKEIW